MAATRWMQKHVTSTGMQFRCAWQERAWHAHESHRDAHSSTPERRLGIGASPRKTCCTLNQRLEGLVCEWMQVAATWGVLNGWGMSQRHLKDQSWTQRGIAIGVWVRVWIVIVIVVKVGLGLVVPSQNRSGWCHNLWIRVWVGPGLCTPSQIRSGWSHTYKRRTGEPLRRYESKH